MTRRDGVTALLVEGALAQSVALCAAALALDKPARTLPTSPAILRQSSSGLTVLYIVLVILAAMTNIYAPLKPLSNGPKAVPNLVTARPAVMGQKHPPGPSALFTEFCSGCATIYPVRLSHGRCARCRAKDEKSRTKTETAQARAARKRMQDVFAVELVTEKAKMATVADVQMTDAMTAYKSAASTSSTKRKAEVLDAEDPYADVVARSDRCKEYQTSQELLDALSRNVEVACSSSSSTRAPNINFHGSFTIVMDPDVRGAPRVKQFVEELTQSSKLRFG